MRKIIIIRSLACIGIVMVAATAYAEQPASADSVQGTINYLSAQREAASNDAARTAGALYELQIKFAALQKTSLDLQAKLDDATKKPDATPPTTKK